MAGRGTIKIYAHNKESLTKQTSYMLAFDLLSDSFRISFKFCSSCRLKDSLSTNFLPSLAYKKIKSTSLAHQLYYTLLLRKP